MAVKKTGLGRGLDALFSENQLTKEEEKKEEASAVHYTGTEGDLLSLRKAAWRLHREIYRSASCILRFRQKEHQ